MTDYMLTRQSHLWLWVPCESYGPIVFGTNLSQTASDIGMILLETFDPIGDRYSFLNDNELTISGNNNVVERVCTSEDLIYEGGDLLDWPLSDIEALFGRADEVGERIDDVGKPYDFESVGLQLWVDDEGYPLSAVLDVGD